MIVITGATGSIGSELCRLLAADNTPCRAIYRKESQQPFFDALELEAVRADFDDIDSMRRAMQDCTNLFLLTAPDQRHVEREIVMIRLAVESGVQHIVKVSTANTNQSSALAYARSHAQIDHYLRGQPIDWTILRPTGFMQNFIEYAHPIGKGILPHMLGDGQISYIDLRDIALVARHVLTQPGHANATYYLTGPAALTVSDVAAELTAGLGHPVRAVNQSEADTRQALIYAGLDAWYTDALIEQFRIGANGGEIDTTGEVARLTGRAPRTLRQFVRDYKNQFTNQ
ncbi:SDR family oxidoreductase [Spirosoma rhododendri]|uniref:SDR family oxidoreductase n=1 Tax=Spirosoma rhododendri TaxID=2728024 RepID=A0A7L5DQE0_9BACT|nr:SDR family oxidoreductase [Spirosoma rhododendri]QJD80355.1 SDR family oxidoreductase [Spirosoma rhododendri]